MHCLRQAPAFRRIEVPPQDESHGRYETRLGDDREAGGTCPERVPETAQQGMVRIVPRGTLQVYQCFMSKYTGDWLKAAADAGI